MTISCEKKNKASGQIEPVLNTDFTDSAEQSMGSVENGVPSKKPVPTKDATSSRKGGAGRQRGAGRDSYYPSTSYYNYYYPGYSGTFGLWNDRSSGTGDGLSMAPQPSYGFQPSGLMKYYGPARIYPPFGYPKQGQFQNGRPMEHKSKGRIWNGSSRLDSRDKPTRKGDYEASDELTCGPRVTKRNDSVDSASVPLGVSGLGNKYNVAEFQAEYEKAKFYVIKSYSEDDVHKCIKYDVWSSTPNGNKRLDAAFHDAEVRVDESGKCPIFLFFSINGSGQFVGLAEMIGKVDFNKSMDFWQLDKWSGFFPVKWHIIKDIPNAQLRHILLENNGNRPVTYTRDTQEIGLKEGLEMLKIFKDYAAKSSILDDFEFYEDREKALHARKKNMPASCRTDVCREDLSSNYSDVKGTDEKGSAKSKMLSDPTVLLVDLTKNLSITSSEQKLGC